MNFPRAHRRDTCATKSPPRSNVTPLHSGPFGPGFPPPLALLLLLCLTVPIARADASNPDATHRAQRIVFLGDSITDGNSYPLLIRQALAEAGRPVPVCVNAGIGGDTAAGMLKRLDRDVFPRRPSLVTLSAGINDVLHKVPDADYERDVTAIAERMKSAKVPLVILTTSILGPKHTEADQHLARYNAILRQVAQKYDCPLADVNHLMHDARAAGKELLEDDQVHPNYEGHRLIARAVLDALGDNDVRVPEKLKVELMPGVVRDWKIRPLGAPAGGPGGADPKPLDDAATARAAKSAERGEEGWKPYKLPEDRPAGHWWLEQERQRGFAVSVDKSLGKAKVYLAFAAVPGPDGAAPKRVFLNPGADVRSIWLNGKRLYSRGETYTGWHVGHERLPAQLRPGQNTLLLETGPQFFLSITDDNDW